VTITFGTDRVFFSGVDAVTAAESDREGVHRVAVDVMRGGAVPGPARSAPLGSVDQATLAHLEVLTVLAA
jgi:hypothetical protein